MIWMRTRTPEFSPVLPRLDSQRIKQAWDVCTLMVQGSSFFAGFAIDEADFTILDRSFFFFPP